MQEASILFPTPRPAPLCERPPACLRDLGLDRVVESVAAGREEYGVEAVFYTPLAEPDAVAFRQEVFRDLQHRGVSETVRAFASAMRSVRANLARADQAHYAIETDRWFLDAAHRYAHAVAGLLDGLAALRLQSRGLARFRDRLAAYAASFGFRDLAQTSARLHAELSALRFAVLVRGLRVSVRPYRGEPDYTEVVRSTFERFRQVDSGSYAFEFRESPQLEGVEARILEGVSRLSPDLFARVAEFRRACEPFPPPLVATFDREAHFYLGYLDYLAPLATAGLPFCFPALPSDDGADAFVEGCFDLELAAQLAANGRQPVLNDFSFRPPERALVVTGPNQGGKTTFARAVGQAFYLASLGCPIPGRHAQLPVPDRVFTHFPRGESVYDLRGELEDDLVRIREVLLAATSRSVVIVNEILSSTALQDAQTLGRRLLGQLLDLDCLCVWVTFLDELASLNAKTVSMVATVPPDHPERRTFRVVRRPADGRAYAEALARRYRLTYRDVRERFAP
ncbi:MAG: DNA mismatch repair protein MutS [Armatimonadota bacterium]|nr:DNA mismatch repair protein MutS [Armatimonadota bacterium]